MADSPDLPPLDDATAAWLCEHLPAGWEGAQLVAETKRSRVVRLATAEGARYFKQDLILPPPEATILARLAPRWPGHIAPVVALDEARGWSLTEDVGPRGLDGAETPAWCEVVEAFARVQLDTGLAPEEWIALGCRDLRGERLLGAVDAMLTDMRPHLDDETGARLDAQRPRVAAACDELAGDGIPATLVHQDLVPENLVLGAAGPVFIDWSDTVVGHPFFGPDRLLDSCWGDAERKAAVIDAYLGAYEGVAAPDRLRASFDAMLSLRVLYEDVRWHHELREVDPESEHARRMRADLVHGLGLVAGQPV